jgi:hypothetical protein
LGRLLDAVYAAGRLLDCIYRDPMARLMDCGLPPLQMGSHVRTRGSALVLFLLLNCFPASVFSLPLSPNTQPSTYRLKPPMLHTISPSSGPSVPLGAARAPHLVQTTSKWAQTERAGGHQPHHDTPKISGQLRKKWRQTSGGGECGKCKNFRKPRKISVHPTCFVSRRSQQPPGSSGPKLRLAKNTA